MADALQGTWVFNDTLSTTSKWSYSVNFTVNTVSHYSLIKTGGVPIPSGDPGNPFLYQMSYDITAVYFPDLTPSWQDEAYKTITITSKLSEVTNGETLLTWLQANATKQSSLSFKHFFRNSPIGTGTIRFRPYTVAEPLPQLTTPANVSADGTTVSWDEVENATSYEVFADNNSIGEKSAT